MIITELADVDERVKCKVWGVVAERNEFYITRRPATASSWAFYFISISFRKAIKLQLIFKIFWAICVWGLHSNVTIINEIYLDINDQKKKYKYETHSALSW